MTSLNTRPAVKSWSQKAITASAGKRHTLNLLLVRRNMSMLMLQRQTSFLAVCDIEMLLVCQCCALPLAVLPKAVFALRLAPNVYQVILCCMYAKSTCTKMVLYLETFGM